MIIEGRERQKVIYIVMEESGKIFHMNISEEEFNSIFLNVNLRELKNELIKIVFDKSDFLYEVTRNEIQIEDTKLIHLLFVDEYVIEEKLYERYVDIFTGLYNRNFWEKIIGNKILIKCETYYTILIMDLDNLKKINDTYGHLAGDEAIKAVSDALLYVLDKNQYAIRFGGDEFLLILPDVNKEEVEKMMRKVSEITSSFFNNVKYNHDLKFCYGYSKTKSYNNFRKAFEKADDILFKEKEKIGY